MADLVGDYLFSDPDFIRTLSTEHRNVFQKLYDEVKYLCKVATAGSKEARELEKVKKVFQEAYRAETKNPTADGGVRYALSGRKTPTYEEITAEKAVHIVDVTGDIESGSYADMKAAVQRKASEEGWFDRPHHNEDTDSLIFLTQSSFSHAYSNLTGAFGEDTIRTMAHIPEVIKDARLLHVAEPKDPTKAESKVYTFIGAIKGVNGVEPVKLTVKEFDFDTISRVPKNIREYFEKNGVPESYDTLYDAHALEVIGIEGIKKEPDASGKGYGETPQAQATSGSDISVADLLNLVNGDARKYVPQPTAKFSLSADDSSAPVRGGIYGKDIALAPAREDIAQAKSEPNLLEQGLTAIANEVKKASTEQKQATLLEQALTAMGNERKADVQEKSTSSDQAKEAYDFFSGLTEEDSGLHSSFAVNGIVINLQNGSVGLRGKHVVSTSYYNGDRVTPWSVAQEFDTFEEAREYASMLGFEAAEYHGGPTPAEMYYGKPINRGENSMADYQNGGTENSYHSSEVNNDILQMVERVKLGQTTGSEKIQLSTVTDGVATRIQELTGVDVHGYKVVVEARQVDHILKEHGENGRSDRSMANAADIAKMEYALNNPDSIVRSGTTRAYVTNKNGKMKPADTVLYEKQNGEGSYYVVQAVPDTNKKTLYVVTAYIGKKGYKNSEATQSTNANSPSATPEAESVIASNNSIPQSEPVVNQAVPSAESMIDRDDFVSRRASRLYEEIRDLKKGVRASQSLGYLLDHGYEWSSVKTALLNIRDNPNQVVNENSAAKMKTPRSFLLCEISKIKPPTS